MEKIKEYSVPVTERVVRLREALYAQMPRIEGARATLVTESYRETEALPIITRRALAFRHIMEKLPIAIHEDELIVGSATLRPRSSQIFPEFSVNWIEGEFETLATRPADPFEIDEPTKEAIRRANAYFRGKTTSELAASYMAPETLTAIEHNIFTAGNYFYNGVGHVTVHYDWVLKDGFLGIRHRAEEALSALSVSDGDYCKRSEFLRAVIISCDAVITYAGRYAALAEEKAKAERDATRRAELTKIAEVCRRVPANGARSFYEACQAVWFVQLVLQIESSGHSISPGRYDQYMYPYYEADLRAGKITSEAAQELIDCFWVKLNDMNKCRDAASAIGFAGYGMFQNLIVGGQDAEGRDATNALSFMCLEASMHVPLPQPSLSVRVWNGTPDAFMMKAAELMRTGIGLPAYYNDEVIIPALMSRGATLPEARGYNIIGCVEPQVPGKTDGWHDAAFFNMCRPLELVFSNGMDAGVQVGIRTGELRDLDTYEKFFDAYCRQQEYLIGLMVNADNAIDVAHAERCPLPFLSSMVEDCIGKGKSVQEGGAIYNFTGPQGFGIANIADGLYAIRRLVYEEKLVTLTEFAEALRENYGKPLPAEYVYPAVLARAEELRRAGKRVGEAEIAAMVKEGMNGTSDKMKAARYQKLLDRIAELPKFGNDDDEIDALAREAAYTYTRPLEKFKNPRGGSYQAGLYPVSANVPLGGQTGATPDGRLAHTPVADGVSPGAGRDSHGPTAAANSVAKLDHTIASNGTLYNMKFHPSALAGRAGLQNFVSLIRTYFENKGMHVQFNVVSRETLLDAQKNPEKYKTLVVRVAGYSALFTTLSRSLQDDIINRTEQAGAK
ncbi:MAG: glycyl radical protein [Clostridia bacterium]|nr:glycyl radical protein [Clostridia bacterium]